MIVTHRIAIGDIHGCYRTFRALLEEKISPSKDDRVYLLGDYIDRGPMARQVLEYIIDLKWQGYQLFPIMGNHEDMLIKATTDPAFLNVWFNNGAEETLRSFDVPESVLFDYEGLSGIPERIMHFISSLPLYYDLEDHIVVHAGLNFRSDNVFADHKTMLWSRDAHYDGSKIENKTIVHGHTPMPYVTISNTIRKNNEKLVNLDAGCVYKDLPGYGRLLGMDLDTRELFVQENVD